MPANRKHDEFRTLKSTGTPAALNPEDPPFTPGPPTSTPVLIAYTPAPTECVRTESANIMQVYLADCVFWVDQNSNESGFRIELSYPNSGEYFLYDVPPTRWPLLCRQKLRLAWMSCASNACGEETSKCWFTHSLRKALRSS